MLTRNVGSGDKILRLVVGGILLAWGAFGAGLAATSGLIATIIGVILLLTALINFCPLFKLLGISSVKSS